MRWPWEKRDRGADATEIAGREIAASLNHLAVVFAHPEGMAQIAAAITNAREPVRLMPGDQITPCPDCGDDAPKFSMALLRPDGERLACQKCPCVFNAWLRDGRVVTFKSHPHSAPFGVPVAEQSQEPPREAARPQMPMPRERPA